MPTTTQKIILWEYDIPVDRNRLLNDSAGVWFYVMSPGDITITDNRGNTGYYPDKNDTLYNIKSLRVDDLDYSKVNSYANLLITDESFWYDTNTTRLYIHFTSFEPPLGRQIYAGAAVGYSMGQSTGYYYNDIYYEPRVSKIFSVKKKKDPLFFGLLKFQSGTIDAINTDGHFDDWRSRNLFASTSRYLVGDVGDSYTDFEEKFTGNIEDDSRTWDKFSVKIEDIRKGFTNAVADNLLTQTEYPYLDDSNVDTPKPVAYGQLFNALCLCLNETETTSTYTFLICDTEFNAVSSLDAVYIEGSSVTPNSTDLAAGTFTLTSTQLGGDSSKEVTADFSMGIDNGVAILKDLVLNYAGKPFITPFWDTTEVATAQSLSRDTSLYLDDDTKLSKAIERVSFDIDGLFFTKDTGEFTVRIYDRDRTPTKIIQTDEWVDEPDIDNNASEFLTSAVIKYRKNLNDDTFRTYENLDYKDSTFAIYKRYKKSTFETGLTTEADAIDKSNTILEYSSNVQDIVQRTTKWENSDLEIMDFVICDPTRRYSETDNYKIYEIIGITKDFEKFEIKLTLRYVREYLPTLSTYNIRVTGADEPRVLSDGDTRMTVE